MIRLIILCILISLFIIGCATHVKYTHPTKAPDHFDIDKNECLVMAHECADKVGSKDDMVVISARTERCLRERGWLIKEHKSFFDILPKERDVRKF